MIRLMFERPEHAPALSMFDQAVVVVGRGGEGTPPDWVLPFPDVSRQQCRFTSGGGVVFVEGLSERSATFVNSRRIAAITRLAPGDVIRFGHCVVRFVGTEQTAPVKLEPVVAPAPAPMATPAPRPRSGPAPEVVAAAVDEPVLADISPLREQARRWELRGQPSELLLRADALRDGQRLLRPGAALGEDGALVRRFIETSARQRRRAWVTRAQVLVAVVATVAGGSATASWLYPPLVRPTAGAIAEMVGGCDPSALARADEIVARAAQEGEVVASLIGYGYALRVAADGGCRREARAEGALRQQLASQRARVLGDVAASVAALELSPDGAYAGVADANGKLSVWDLRGRVAAVWPTDVGGPVHVLAWSGDGRWLATGGSEPEVVLWDTHHLPRVERTRALDLQGPATAVAFSPEGALLATGDRRGLRLWDIAGDAHEPLVGLHNGLPAAASRLVFDAAGTRLYGLVGGQVYVWPIGVPGAVRLGAATRFESDRSVTAMAVDLGGHQVVTGDTAGQVLVWTHGARGWTSKHAVSHGDEVVQVQIVAARGAVVSAAEDSSLRMVELGPRARGGAPFPRSMATQETALRLVVDPGGRRMFTAGATAAPELWDLAANRGEPLERLTEQRSPVTAVALAELQSTVVTGGEDGVLRAWDLMVDRGSAGAHVLGDHPATIDAFALGRAGSTLASVGRDEHVRVWSIDDAGVPGRVAVWTPRRAVQRLALSHDGRWLAGASGNLVYVWDVRTRDAEARPIELAAHEEDVQQLGFSGAGEWLVTADRRGSVLTWRVAAGGPDASASRRVELAAEVTALALAGERVAVGTTDAQERGRVYAWSLAEEGDARAPVWEHSRGVTALVIDDAGRSLASGSADGGVIAGAWRDGRFVSTAGGYNLGAEIKALATMDGPDGVVLALGGDNGDVVVRAADGEVRRFRGHAGTVRGLAFVGDADTLLTAGQDGALSLWNLTGAGESPPALQLTGHTGAIRGLHVDAGGQVAVTMGVDQTLRVWPLTTAGLLHLACGVAGRDLRAPERGRVLVDLAPTPLCGRGD